MQVVLQVFADGIALQVIVVESEQGKGDDDHKGCGEQNLVAELQVFVHVVLYPDGSGTSLVFHHGVLGALWWAVAAGRVTFRSICMSAYLQ